MSSDMDLGLAKKILALAKTETQAREAFLFRNNPWGSDPSKLIAVQKKVATQLTEIASTTGWPSISGVGWDAAFAAATLARNCLTQPGFMRSVLPVIEQAYRFGEISSEWFACHYDAIMFFEGKPQVFGTYLEWDSNGQLSLWQVADEKNLDSRRSLFFLEPLAEYIKNKRLEVKTRDRKPPIDFMEYQQRRDQLLESLGWNRPSAKQRAENDISAV